MANGIVFLHSRNEKTEGGHGNEERKRQFSVLAGSREGSGTQTAAREGAAGRGAASWLSKQAFTVLTLFLGKGFSMRPVGQEMCQCSLCGLPCPAGGSAAVLGHPLTSGWHPWDACPSLGGEGVWWLPEGTSKCVCFEIWEPEESRSLAGPPIAPAKQPAELPSHQQPQCRSRCPARHSLGLPSLRALLLSIL